MLQTTKALSLTPCPRLGRVVNFIARQRSLEAVWFSSLSHYATLLKLHFWLRNEILAIWFVYVCSEVA